MTPEQTDRYLAAMHAIQSAIALEIQVLGEDEAGASPKHLRVGVNSALSTYSALVVLLVEKGIISREDYEDAVVDAAELEATRCRQRAIVSCGLPPNTTFG